MINWLKYRAFWLLFRIPRIYMGRTEYAFWLMGWREHFRRRISK